VNLSAGSCGCRLLGTDLWFPDAFAGRVCVDDMKSGMDVAVIKEIVLDLLIAVFDPRIWQNDLQ
jgi:hypothetical protein